MRGGGGGRAGEQEDTPDLFADFNGIDPEARAEFYAHDQNWTNRMILGDSLQVMASLAEKEGLRGKVQCIYFDPPYGIRFNSNFQWSTTSSDVTNGKADHITREPEQVKAFRDTWRDGIHSYLMYLRDRLTVARDLLSESGAIFVQIGDENVHRVRCALDEVFGEENIVSEILVKKKGSQKSNLIGSINDYILFYSKNKNKLKFRKIFEIRDNKDLAEDFPYVDLGFGYRDSLSQISGDDGINYRVYLGEFKKRYPNARLFGLGRLKSGGYRVNQSHDFYFRGRIFPVSNKECWKHTVISKDKSTPGMERLGFSDRLYTLKKDIHFVRYAPNPPIKQISNWWDGFGGASNSIYVVQTNTELVKRCILLVTDPGDLVMDPTCGAGTTAYVGEQWGRRWITIDTSRVALALARARLMGARFPCYLLMDSPEGQKKEATLTETIPADKTHGNIRHGFVYRRVSSTTSGEIAGNSEIDVIWNRFQEILEPLRAELNAALGQAWAEWEIPREADTSWPEAVRTAHANWWEARIERQKEIDASIAAKADQEYLYDKPYEDKSRVRVAGPFTVESLSPHRVLAVDENDEFLDELAAAEGRREGPARSDDATDFDTMVIENLKRAGVQQPHKEDRIAFTAIAPWPGRGFIAAEGRYLEGGQEVLSTGGATGTEQKAGAQSDDDVEAIGTEKRAAILIGPEFGTVSRPDLVAAAREAAECGFDVLIACAFNFDAHTSEFESIGRLPILKARMNPDLHMAGDLKTGKSDNLFVVFGEPDIDIEEAGDDCIRVRINGVDVFHPSTGEIVSGGPDDIACWFIDTDYNEESFFVRHAYFPGTTADPYEALKTTLKAEIDEDAWSSLNSTTSRPFEKPSTGRIAVKAINHLGDEVMKVFRV